MQTPAWRCAEQGEWSERCDPLIAMFLFPKRIHLLLCYAEQCRWCNIHVWFCNEVTHLTTVCPRSPPSPVGLTQCQEDQIERKVVVTVRAFFLGSCTCSSFITSFLSSVCYLVFLLTAGYRFVTFFNFLFTICYYLHKKIVQQQYICMCMYEHW